MFCPGKLRGFAGRILVVDGVDPFPRPWDENWLQYLEGKMSVIPFVETCIHSKVHYNELLDVLGTALPSLPCPDLPCT